MSILVETESRELTPGLKFDLERRIGRIFRRTSKSIRNMSVSFGVFMPMGRNVITQCRLIVTLVGAQKIVVIGQGKTTEKAYKTALHMVEDSLNNQNLRQRQNASQKYNTSALLDVQIVA